MLRLVTTLLIVFVGSSARAAETLAPPEQQSFEKSVQPFLATYCLRCHDAKKQEGNFRLDTLARDFADQAVAQRWDEVVFRMNTGEMPPKKEQQPKPSELGQAVDWISSAIKAGEAARMARRGPVAHYRLSREEYGNTIYDLLGVYFDVTLPGAFIEEPRWHGFERIGSMLSLSPSHVDRYFRAAEIIVQRAFPAQPAAAKKGRQEAEAGKRWLFWPGHGRQAVTASAPGLYRIRVQLSALPSFKGRLPHLALWHQGLKRSIVGRDVSAPEDKPTVVEIEAFLPEGNFNLMNESPGMLSDGHTLSNTPATFVGTKEPRVAKPTGYKLFDEEGRPIFPMLIVDWIEFEGPITSAADQAKREGAYPVDEKNLVETRSSLKRFAERAWRRPVSEADLERYMKIFQGEVSAGENLRSAYLAALVGVLTSKNFYYLEEGSPTGNRNEVNDWELASRLSYFLWSSMPDEELFSAARAGTLHAPDVLRAQTKRMLADPKISRFTESFPRQWLQLHRVGMFPPDAEMYPDYDKWLERSMVLETTGFFGEVFAKNLPLREFLASDWTMMNPRLALHYRLPPPAETGLQRIMLRPEDHLGGLLTQASVLMLTSDGTRHRPVHRGVWVSEAIFGKTPPPPPPNVEPLAPTPSDHPKATIRMQLEAHATHAVCASCHRKIDPLGFAFDNFDALGRWRTEETATTGQGDNPVVNASGTLPDGRAFQGPDEFKQLLIEDLDRFAESFVEQLATFALRRVMTIDDAAQIKAIAQAGKKDGYRLRTLIELLVSSDLFRKR
ncbi:MAG: DUF1592 domain-containing protein [Planctomycetia bacterium]|nr:DUF1592 domain-containing protein [Planctomycetia bacterium]